ncbi:CDGSH iron-sulfur domain-containing protein [Arthrobacter sp. zg-Y1116]|uniref:CDGSH iron-sulfur domain-containing protein n=1 Tax=Arthrobacter sp. zg-Y1116 TaxID=2964611 RepID=UPI00351D4B76
MTAPAAGPVDEKDTAQDALTEANAEQADVQAEQDGADAWKTREGTAPASIVACPNGPLLVRGDFEIVTPDGVPVPRDRETVALCRCGGSAIKPYCDGTHKLMKFDTARRRPVPAPARKAAEEA